MFSPIMKIGGLRVYYGEQPSNLDQTIWTTITVAATFFALGVWVGRYSSSSAAPVGAVSGLALDPASSSSMNSHASSAATLAPDQGSSTIFEHWSTGSFASGAATAQNAERASDTPESFSTGSSTSGAAARNVTAGSHTPASFSVVGSISSASSATSMTREEFVMVAYRPGTSSAASSQTSTPPTVSPRNVDE